MQGDKSNVVWCVQISMPCMASGILSEAGFFRCRFRAFEIPANPAQLSAIGCVSVPCKPNKAKADSSLPALGFA